MISVLLILCLSLHVFRLEEHNLSLKLAMLWFSTGVLRNYVARDRIREGVAIGALQFRQILTEFEDLCLVHILQQFLRCFTEPVDLLRLTRIFKNFSINLATVCCLCSSCC